MRRIYLRTVLIIVASLPIMLSGCVTEVAPDLPLDQLPILTTGAPVKLAASPTHPNSELPGAPVPASTTLTVLGQDETGSALLVFDGKRLGWFPSFYSSSDIATEGAPLIIDPLPANCGKYLGAIGSFSEQWTATQKGSVIIYGAIYRPQAANRTFAGAELSLQLSNGARAVGADYVHLRLNTESAIAVFAFAVDGVDKGTRVDLRLRNQGGETLITQAAFFSNLCRSKLNTGEAQFVQSIPVGKERVFAQRWNFTGDEGSSPAPEPTPRIIYRSVGPRTICQPKYTSRLKPGMHTWAISSGKINLRSGPGKQYPRVTQIGPGERMTVLEGSICSDNMHWWRVQLDRNESGWVSEGDEDEYLLGPQQEKRAAPATACSASAGPSFGRLWTSARQGCPRGSETGVTTAYESFERGWMLWRQDNLVHYAFYADGRYVSFWYPSAEPPDFSCDAARVAGKPRRGFGKVWCENPEVREQIGSATMNEIGDWRPVQEFDRGFMIYIKERGTVVTVFGNGTWMEQR